MTLVLAYEPSTVMKCHIEIRIETAFYYNILHILLFGTSILAIDYHKYNEVTLFLYDTSLNKSQLHILPKTRPYCQQIDVVVKLLTFTGRY